MSFFREVSSEGFHYIILHINHCCVCLYQALDEECLVLSSGACPYSGVPLYISFILI